MKYLNKRSAPNAFLRGGAPRSELIIFMIAGGNHTIILMVGRRQAARMRGGEILKICMQLA